MMKKKTVILEPHSST